MKDEEETKGSKDRVITPRIIPRFFVEEREAKCSSLLLASSDEYSVVLRESMNAFSSDRAIWPGPMAPCNEGELFAFAEEARQTLSIMWPT